MVSTSLALPNRKLKIVRLEIKLNVPEFLSPQTPRPYCSLLKILTIHIFKMKHKLIQSSILILQKTKIQTHLLFLTVLQTTNFAKTKTSLPTCNIISILNKAKNHRFKLQFQIQSHLTSRSEKNKKYRGSQKLQKLPLPRAITDLIRKRWLE